MSSPSLIHRGFLLLGVSMLCLGSLQAQVTTPGLLKALQGKEKKALQTRVAHNARQVGIALFAFHADYNKLPGEATIKSLSEVAKDGVKIAADSANDCFFQLLVGGYVDNPAVFSPLERDRGRGNVGADKKLANCFYSYIPSKGFDRAERPLMVAPLIKGKTTFNPKPLGGKAVVMFSDLSVRILDINEDGVVKLNGKDLFDPQQGYWEGEKPQIKWQE